MVHHGVGTQMLRRLETEAKNKGITVLLASISSKNEPSLRFYQAMGFSECGRFPGVGWKNGVVFDVVWMAKILA